MSACRGCFFFFMEIIKSRYCPFLSLYIPLQPNLHINRIKQKIVGMKLKDFLKTKRIKALAALLLCTVMAVAQNGGTEKTGILLVHYGTQNAQSRALTIDRLNKRVGERFPDSKVVEAYAAPTVIRTLGKKGIRKLSIAQALDSLKAMGCTRLAVQSTMLLDGVMTDMLNREVAKAEKNFRHVEVARPLLYSVDDCRQMVAMIRKNLEADKSLKAAKSQVVLVGHGSDSPANAMYSQIDYLLKDEGMQSWHVGTIEGYPTIECVERRLGALKNKSVILVPLLYIAGNHQKEDIDGVWKNKLQEKGYSVSVVEKGLGEMPEIQDMIIGNIEKLLKK